MKKKLGVQLLSLFLATIIICGMAPIKANAWAANPYPPSYPGASSNCTYVAWQQTYNRTGVALPAWGNAGNWYQAAKNAGYQCIDYYSGCVPPANSIAVWEGGYGHVGYVVEANSSSARVYEGNITWAGTYYKELDHWVAYPYLERRGSQRLLGFILPSATNQNIGDDFYALIIKDNAWKPIVAQANGNVELSTEKGTAKEYWRFKRQGDGSYKIFSSENGMVMSVQGGGTANGTNVHVFEDWNTDSQKWYVRGSYPNYQITSKMGNYALDVSADNNADGANVQIWTPNNSTAQKFAIYVVKFEGTTLSYANKGNGKISFTWPRAKGSTAYNLRIFKKNSNGTESDFSKWGLKSESLDVTLAAGTYRAYVDAVNGTNDVRKSNELSFTISSPVLSSIAISTLPQKRAYIVGEKFNKAGMVVSARYNNGSKKNITNYSYSPSGALKTTDKYIKITYKEGSVTKTVTQPISVTQRKLSSFTLNSSNISLVQGKTYGLKVSSYTPSNTTSSKTAAWKSSNAKVASVSSAGLVKAAGGGTATISCTVAGITKTCKVTVKAYPLKSFTLNSSSLVLTKGATVPLSVSAYSPSNTTSSKTAVWKSSNTKVATVSSKGLVKATGGGIATISCTVAGITKTCTVTIPVPMSSFMLNKASLSLNKGNTYALKVTSYTPSNTTSSKKAVWKSSNTRVATVSSAGTIKAVGKGSATISCTVAGITKSCRLTVYDYPLQSFALNKVSLGLNKGNTYALKVTSYTPSNTTSSKTAVWKSSNTKVATVSSSGTIKAVGKGSATISCTVAGITKSCRLTVYDYPLQSFALNKVSLGLNKGNTYALKVTSYTPSNTTSSKKAVWKSSNTRVATVSSAGTIKAVGKGSATISCTVAGITKSCRLTVSDYPLQSFALNKVSLGLNKGNTYALKVTSYTPSNTTSSKKAVWKSSNTRVATVSSAGTIKAVGKGSATISCTVAGITKSCKLVVSDITDQYLTKLYTLINAERKKAGVPALIRNKAVEACAMTRAKELETLFSHYRPDGSMCFSVLEEKGVQYYSAGENIAEGQPSPEAVMKSWMNSPGHKSNILSPSYNNVGVGLYIDPKTGYCHWVQLFTGQY